jgi:electron transfer flavoprotein alpha subunit
LLVCGWQCGPAARAAATVAGGLVLVADAPASPKGWQKTWRRRCCAGRRISHVMATATAAGKNALPRVAALLGVAQVSEITRVVDAETFERPIYAGNVIATVRSSDPSR